MTTLYNSDILRLAASIPHHQRLERPMASVERRSPICGSHVTLDLTLHESHQVAAVGLAVRACALGQASASLLARHIIGRHVEELTAIRHQLAEWLAGRADVPHWPGIDVLAPALPHHARHASIRLAFEAADDAAQQAAALVSAG